MRCPSLATATAAARRCAGAVAVRLIVRSPTRSRLPPEGWKPQVRTRKGWPAENRRPPLRAGSARGRGARGAGPEVVDLDGLRGGGGAGVVELDLQAAGLLQRRRRVGGGQV